MSGRGHRRALYCAAWIASGRPAEYGFAIGRRGVKVGKVAYSERGWYFVPPTRRWWTTKEPEWFARRELFGYTFFRRGIACRAGYRTVKCRQNREGRYYQVSFNLHNLEVFRRNTDSTRSTRVFVRHF